MARLLFLALAFACSAFAQQDLTGRWTANDGGTYYIRQLGNELWRYGESGDGGRSWTNVISDWSDHKDGIDAGWCYAEWRCGKTGEAWQQLRIDDKGMSDHNGSMLAYNPQHVYRVRIQGQGRPIVAYASDAQNSWSDN